MDKTQLKISVVTVCYNAVDCIEETMLSVLDQTYPNIEYIVIDGGSSDGTADIIRKYADRLAYWVSEPDKGIYDAMNKGIVAATGDYINFMNAGDRFADDSTLSRFVPCIDNDTTVAFGDWNILLDSRVSRRKPLAIKYLDSKLIFSHQAAFVSLAYHKANLFDTSFRIAADYNLVYNAVKRDNKKLQYIPEIIADYDVSTINTSVLNFKLLMREKYRIWGIENNMIKKLPNELYLFRIRLSLALRRILPASVVLTIKRCLDSRRTHFN